MKVNLPNFGQVLLEHANRYFVELVFRKSQQVKIAFLCAVIVTIVTLQHLAGVQPTTIPYIQ